MALEIEDYALIGNCRTAALVGRNGSIDWMCVPRFDSPACFAALLGTKENGYWQIEPREQGYKARRRYRPETLVLETDFETSSGKCRLIDFMPIDSDAATVRLEDVTVVRLVVGLEGRVDLQMRLVIRFDYGHLVPWVNRSDGELLAVAGSDLLVLRTPVAHEGRDFTTCADFTAEVGVEFPFTLSRGPSHRPAPARIDPKAALAQTETFWSQWASRCNYEGEWRDIVVRSLITLKALTYGPTGGMVAAPTTSLPEQPGGNRNWDYRFCWLRDATFVLLSLMQAGYREEAESWRAWLVRAAAGLPSQLQPIYSVLGDRRIDEWSVPWLPGYGNAAPVRIGNDAYSQLQLDTFGEVIDALHHARRRDLPGADSSWPLQLALLQHLETLLDSSDRGIWEFRGADQQFTYSKVMMWVAFDRAVAAVKRFGMEGPIDHWRKLRARLHAEICAKAFDPALGSFVQSYGSRQLDASTLLIPHVGFLPPDDPRMKGTVEAIGRRLMRDGFVHRYDTRESEDGLPPGEGVFLACTCWFADNLILQGRRAEGREIFQRMLAICNDVGLLAEEYDVTTRTQLGNFPQALSHLALIGTAYNLREPQGPAKERTKHRP